MCQIKLVQHPPHFIEGRKVDDHVLVVLNMPVSTTLILELFQHHVFFLISFNLTSYLRLSIHSKHCPRSVMRPGQHTSVSTSNIKRILTLK